MKDPPPGSLAGTHIDREGKTGAGRTISSNEKGGEFEV